MYLSGRCDPSSDKMNLNISLQLFIDAPHNMPSVSSDDGGLEEREDDFFELSEKESEKIGEVRNASAVCSVPKVASGANLASVRLPFFCLLPNPRLMKASLDICLHHHNGSSH